MSMYRPHWMPSVGDPGGYNGHQAQPPPLHPPPAPHQASTWPTPPPSTRLASSASPPSSYSSSSATNIGQGVGTNSSSSNTGNPTSLPPTPPKDSHNVQQTQSQDHQLGHHHTPLHSHLHQPKHEPGSSHHYPESQSNSGCLMPSVSGSSSYDTSLSREDPNGCRINTDQGIDQYNHHHQHHETKDNLLTAKSELNPPSSSMGAPNSLDIKNQPQSPISHGSTYDQQPPSSSSSNYISGASAGIGSTNEHDGYGPNTYPNIQTSSSSAYSPPLHPHHQGQHPHHTTHHNSSGSSLLGAPMGGDPVVRGSASSTGGSDYSANNLSPPINHSGISDAGLSTYSSSGHMGAIRPNSTFNSSSSTSKGSSKGKNRPNAGRHTLCQARILTLSLKVN